jgi:hypothetical protein
MLHVVPVFWSLPRGQLPVLAGSRAGILPLRVGRGLSRGMRLTAAVPAGVPERPMPPPPTETHPPLDFIVRLRVSCTLVTNQRPQSRLCKGGQGDGKGRLWRRRVGRRQRWVAQAARHGRLRSLNCSVGWYWAQAVLGLNCGPRIQALQAAPRPGHERVNMVLQGARKGAAVCRWNTSAPIAASSLLQEVPVLS